MQSRLERASATQLTKSQAINSSVIVRHVECWLAHLRGENFALLQIMGCWVRSGIIFPEGSQSHDISQPFQVAPFRRPDHPAVRALVSALLRKRGTQTRGQMMPAPVERLSPMEKIMLALADFEYLTAEQLTRLLYAKGSLTYVKAKLKTLVEADFILPLGGRNHNLPRIYTLKVKGRQFTTMLGKPTELRFRPGEAYDKAYNLFFMRHTLAVINVLIAARLLTQTIPGIVLNNMFQERELRRKIYVAISQDKEKPRNICLEPDASLDFTIQQAWRDFFILNSTATCLWNGVSSRKSRDI
jgi:hypothetical protein